MITTESNIDEILASGVLVDVRPGKIVKLHRGPDGKNSVSHDLRIDAKFNPFPVESWDIYVPQGYKFYFARTSGNTWKFDPSRGYHGAEGIVGSTNDDAWRAKAWEGQLIGVDRNKPIWFGYDPRCDRSRGGTYYWVNEDPKPETYLLAMNDDYYPDNVGFMNATIIIEEA
ncbi:MAG: hypothetical protein NTW96_05390 [Planctomycetia bacterium]|nr:hypothetical protein [Planctomycetia bacterium]